MKVFEKENPPVAEWMERISLKKNQPFSSSRPSVKYKNFSDYVSNIEQRREGADKRHSPLNWLLPFPTRRVYDYGFRVFSFLCFIKDGIHSHNSPLCPLPDISQRSRGRKDQLTLGWLSIPGKQLSEQTLKSGEPGSTTFSRIPLCFKISFCLGNE